MVEAALQVTVSAGTLAAMWTAGSRWPWAWHLALVNQVAWWVLIAVEGLWGLAPMAAALTVVYARNAWRAERVRRRFVGTHPVGSWPA